MSSVRSAGCCHVIKNPFWISVTVKFRGAPGFVPVVTFWLMKMAIHWERKERRKIENWSIKMKCTHSHDEYSKQIQQTSINEWCNWHIRLVCIHQNDNDWINCLNYGKAIQFHTINTYTDPHGQFHIHVLYLEVFIKTKLFISHKYQ